MALIDMVDEKVVKVPLEAQTKVDVLRELIDLLEQNDCVKDPHAALQALLERETQGSTGLEMGIAVPHAKTEAVDDLTLAVGISPEGIDFEAADGEKSQLFFLILAPPNQPGRHIELLSEI